MPRTSSSRIIVLGLAAAAIGLAAYGTLGGLGKRQSAGGLRTPHVAPSAELAFEPTEEQRQAIEALRSRVAKDNPHFSQEDARQKANAKLFTFMAATSEDPVVVQASLEAIQSAYSSRSAQKESPDADLDRVLLKHLRSGQSPIVVAALAAARIPLMSEQPGLGLMVALAQMAGSDQAPARRYAALEALNLIRPDRRSREVLEAFEVALSAPEAYVVSAALFALAQSGPSFNVDPQPKSEQLGPRVIALVAHADPGVRGRALDLLATLEWLVGSELRIVKARECLADAHPYVRAQAADVLGRARQSSAIHSLIRLVDDMEAARYEQVGWTALDASPGRLEHALLGRRRVAEAALYAIRTLSSIGSHAEGQGPEQKGSERQGVEGQQGATRDSTSLVLTIGGPQQSDGDVRKNAGIAKAWYEKSRNGIPSE